MSTFGGADIVKDGLVLALDAGSERSYPGSGTAWYDISGGGNTATLSAGISYDNGYGGNFVFNGSGYIINDTVSSILNSDTFTIELDLLPTVDTYASGPGGRVIWSTHTSYSNRFMFIVSPTTGRIGCFTYSSYGGNLSVANITTDDDAGKLGSEWKKVHFVRTTATNIDIYMNGVYNAYHTVPDYTDINQFSLGQEWDSSNPSDYYYGKQGPLKIYDRVLTQAEITQNYNAQKTRFGL